MAGPLLKLRRFLGRWKREYIVREFNVLYYTGCHSTPLYQTTNWLGVPVFKAPTDLFVYQEIVDLTEPEVIVETGVNFGGSTLFFANLCDLRGRGEVIAVDITLEKVPEQVRRHPRITLIEGSSTSEEVRSRVGELCLGKKTMVALDSDHSAAHVLRELEFYGPLVSPGCYMIVEDTNVNGHPVFKDFGPGPMEAVEEFLRTHEGWEIDRNCERLLVTFNPSGFLRRTED
jgi:cephalosporin hydroxylase